MGGLVVCCPANCAKLLFLASPPRESANGSFLAAIVEDDIIKCLKNDGFALLTSVWPAFFAGFAEVLSPKCAPAFSTKFSTAPKPRNYAVSSLW